MRHMTNNFKSINDSLALKHQQLTCNRGFHIQDDIKHGTLRELKDVFVCPNYLEAPLDQIRVSKFLRVNNFKYKKGLFVLHENKIYEIARILSIRQEFYFDGIPYVALMFDHFYNSPKIE